MDYLLRQICNLYFKNEKNLFQIMSENMTTYLHN